MALSHLQFATLKPVRCFRLQYISNPSCAGLLPFFRMLLSPMVAAAAMSLSSVTVVSNALRLRAMKL